MASRQGKPTAATFKVGDIVWFETGIFTASRVQILEMSGHGAARVYRVLVLDHSPDQSDASDVNTHHWKDGGIQVSYRKCKAIKGGT